MAKKPPNGMANFLVKVDHDYWPVAELLHGSRSLRLMGVNDPNGARWKFTGALLLLASVVEAFCQTAGPKVYGHDWDKRLKIERSPILEKIQAIAQHAGIDVSPGTKRGQALKKLIDARNDIAHPKPRVTKHEQRVTASVGSDPWQIIDAARVWDKSRLLDAKRLEQLEETITNTLSAIWKGLNASPAVLFMDTSRLYSVSKIGK